MGMIDDFTTPFYGRMKRYWRRRQYQRLDGTNDNKRVIRLGGKRKRSWKIKIMPKLKLTLTIVLPLRLLGKLRDAYVHMMLDVAKKVGSLDGNNFFGSRRISEVKKSGNKVPKAIESNRKLIFEIYKALEASHEVGVQ